MYDLAEEFNQQNEKKALKCANYMLMCVYGVWLCCYCCASMNVCEIDLKWKIVNQIEL